MPRKGSTNHRGYGHRYRLARAAILGPAGNGNLPVDPPCYWCGNVATTADHNPPLKPGEYHLRLVPACAPCNYGHRNRSGEPRVNPSRNW